MKTNSFSRARSSERPLVTFTVPAYNQEDSVRAAVESAFSQTYSPLEIILSDDCSTDGTFEVIAEMAAEYSGPHRVKVNRNERNLGIIGNVNRIFSMAGGELVVAGAGDDISLPGRTEELVNRWISLRKKPDGLCSSFVARTSAGKEVVVAAPVNFEIEHHCRFGTSRLPGATAAWSRRLVSRWGQLPANCLAEDKVLTFRALLGGGIEVVHKPLVYTHGGGQKRGGKELSWRVKEIWRLERILLFLDAYERDLEVWSKETTSRAARVSELKAIIRRAKVLAGRDVRHLVQGRVGILTYAGSHVLGTTFHSGGFPGRLCRAFYLVRRYLTGDTNEEFIDATDHRCLRKKGPVVSSPFARSTS